jgi:hypothetical protein
MGGVMIKAAFSAGSALMGVPSSNVTGRHRNSTLYVTCTNVAAIDLTREVLP